MIYLFLHILMLNAIHQNADVKAWIGFESKDGNNIITANFINYTQTPVNYNYSLNVMKQGKSGISSNNQSGSFKASPQEQLTLSNVTIKADQTDYYKVQLIIQDVNNTIIASDTLEEGKKKE